MVIYLNVELSINQRLNESWRTGGKGRGGKGGMKTGFFKYPNTYKSKIGYIL